LRRSSAEVLIVETGRNKTSVLEAGAVAGIPVFSHDENFVTVERENLQRRSGDDDDVASFFSLQGRISVDGEEWTVESASCRVAEAEAGATRRGGETKRLYPSLSKEFKNLERNIDDDNRWTPVLVLVSML
jgi:hypothetical protein